MRLVSLILKNYMKTVIFDMDGVILDDEYPYLARTKDFLESKGIFLSLKELSRFVGLNDRSYYEYLSFLLGEDLDITINLKNEYNRKHTLDHNVFLKKDALFLLEYLKRNSYRMALATAADRENTMWKLKHYNLAQYFEIIVCGNDVKRTKPYPDVYLKTLGLLKTNSKECIVIEDSTIGIKAAKKAVLIVIANFDPRINLDVSEADYVITDLRKAIDIIKGA